MSGLTLIRQPRTRGMNLLIRRELRKSYKGIFAPAVIRKYEDVAKLGLWDVNPKFVIRIRIRRSLIRVMVGTRKNHEASEIFRMVDMGTMDEGNPATTYSIDASDPRVPLSFTVPYQPLTYPPDGLGYDIGAPEQAIRTQHVDHPGIKPRHFSVEVLAWAKDRHNSDGFYRVTENAYRRAFNQIMRLKRRIGMG